MTSKNFVPFMAEAMDCSQAKAKAAIDAFELALKNYVAACTKEVNAENPEVSFKAADLKFKVFFSPAHEARNPATGDTVVVPDACRMKISGAPDFKDILKSR